MQVQYYCYLYLGIVFAITANARNNVRRLKRDIRPNKFIHVRKNCTDDSLHIEVETSEPFRGTLYTKGYPHTHCRAIGDGNTKTTLTIKPQSCGLSVQESQTGRHDTFEVQLYIQFDRYVQQVIDEQVHIRCLLEHPLKPTHLNSLKIKGKTIDTDNLSKIFKKQMKVSDKENVDKGNIKKKEVLLHGFNKDTQPKWPIGEMLTLTNSSVSFGSGISIKPEPSISSNFPNSGRVVSEIKVSSSPKETEAMVASTLLTVSSRVKERLKSREKNVKDDDSKSMDVNDLLKRMTGEMHSGENKINSADENADGEDDKVSEWKPATGLVDGPYDLDEDINNELVSAWMDIKQGNDYNGKKSLRGLDVGEEATLVVTVRAEEGLKATVANCRAHDGSDGGIQDLTDARGCAVDPAIMPQLKMVRKGHEEIFHATFRTFKFPDRNHLHLTCTVVVCLGKCPQSDCGVLTARKSRRKGRKIVGIGEFYPTDILTSQTFGVKQPTDGTITVSLGDNSKGPSTSKSQKSNTIAKFKKLLKDINSQSSDERHGMILDRIDVYNSVEVRAPGIESQPSDLKQQKYLDSNDEDMSARKYLGNGMICMAPQKLMMSFGVLLAIVVGVLLFAIYHCARRKIMPSKRYISRDAKFLRHLDRSKTPVMANLACSPPPICPTTPNILSPNSYYRFHR